MKKLKKIFYVGLVLFSVVLISSTFKKSVCSHCVIKDSNGAIIKDYGQKCGTTTDVDNYERSAREDAVQYNGTITCTN